MEVGGGGGRNPSTGFASVAQVIELIDGGYDVKEP